MVKYNKHRFFFLIVTISFKFRIPYFVVSSFINLDVNWEPWFVTISLGTLNRVNIYLYMNSTTNFSVALNKALTSTHLVT